MHILLLGGGWSDEHEVSLTGAKAIEQALLDLGHRVTFLDPRHELHRLPEAARMTDFAFINLHGKPGEDGLLQAMLDSIGCPYQGTKADGSLLALNKAAGKSLFQSAGIPTPAWEFLPRSPAPDWQSSLGFPLFVKPNTGGSSLGIALAEGHEELRSLLSRRFELCEEILLEERVQGMEITCAVLGEETLPPILVKPPSTAGFFDFSSKYTPQASEEICPAPIGPKLTSLVEETALRVHRLLGLSGYSRTDCLFDGETLYVLEANTVPGMTETSLLPLAAEQRGYAFKDLVAKLIELALQEHARSALQDNATAPTGTGAP